MYNLVFIKIYKKINKNPFFDTVRDNSGLNVKYYKLDIEFYYFQHGKY